MKISAKEAYMRMKSGKICLGKAEGNFSGLKYRIVGDLFCTLQYLGFDDIWKRSENSPINMLRMEWSTLDEKRNSGWTFPEYIRMIRERDRT